MDDTTKVTRSLGAVTSGPAEKTRLRRRYPTIAYLRRRAARHIPRFAYEYLDGGAGADGGIARNWRALDAVQLIPRYGRLTELLPTATELFGRAYAAPIGIAPMGEPAIVWPGADRYLAAAAHMRSASISRGAPMKPASMC